MSEEEKKAIEKINKSYDDNTGFYEAKDIDWCIICNLIEKQQKEIEVLNNQIIELQQQKIIDKNSISQQDNFFDYYNYIHKDKIREKMEELLKEGELMTEEQRQKETEYMQGKLRAYEELLEE